MKKRTALVTGIIFTVLFFVINVAFMNGYGLTWDFHHHFFSGLYMLGHPIGPDLLNHLPFTEPYPITSVQLPFGPLMTVFPVTTYLLFFEKLHLMAFDNAYNLAIIVSGVSGIFVLFLFLLEATDVTTALTGLLILALYPRYVGDLHNNMKDIPQAGAFALAVWMFWRMIQKRRLQDILLAALAFGVAFNTKVNTVFMPVVGILWVLVLIGTRTSKKLQKPFSGLRWPIIRVLAAYGILAGIAAVAIWWPFWDHPLERLLYLPKFFSLNTVNVEVLYYGKWYCSSVDVPWHYPIGYLAAVTPLPVLILFLVGLIVTIRNIFRKQPLASLLLLWFLVPIARYLSPRIGVMDGIRHFEEVVYPLAAIAAVGAVSLYTPFLRRIRNRTSLTKSVRSFLLGLPVLLLGAYLVTINVIYYPHQISYFSELVGGIRGAQGQFDIDYWGTSQKQAILWLNKHAPKDAVIDIIMMPDVSAKYLRPDLLTHVNTKGFDDSDYVVVLNRESFFYRYFYLWEYFLRRKTAYVVENQGVPLVWVYDNSLGQTPRRQEWWHGDSPCIRHYWTSPTP